jgi:hypothetical protein
LGNLVVSVNPASVTVTNMAGRPIPLTTDTADRIAFDHRRYQFLITLDRPGRTFVVRRCAGGPCESTKVPQ